jgi:hypothetical protein
MNLRIPDSEKRSFLMYAAQAQICPVKNFFSQLFPPILDFVASL